MAHIDEHCKDCGKLLGHAWFKVHQFLDQYAEIFDPWRFGEYHRTFLHNRYGIEVARSLWGSQAETAAIIHIVRDYMEMPIDGKDLKWIKYKLGKALVYFNNMDNFDPRLDPRIVKGWKGKSFVGIAMGDKP